MLDSHIGCPAGPRFPYDGENGRNRLQIFEANGKAVANRFIKGRRVGIGQNVFAKNTAHGIPERYNFGQHPIRAVLHLRDGHHDFKPALNRKHSRMLLRIPRNER